MSWHLRKLPKANGLWLIAFITLSALDCGLTWIILTQFGGYEALGVLFTWLPSTNAQMLYKLGVSVAMGVAAYYVKARWILKLGTCLLTACCVWNGFQMLLALRVG